MMGGLLTVLMLLLSPALLILHDSPSEVQNPNPKIKMTITVSDPQSDGLYLDNQWVHVVVNVQNISDEPIFLHVDGDFRSITPDSSKQLDILSEEAKKIEPNESSPYKLDRVLFAGNYRLYVTAGVVNGTSTVKQFIGKDARGELYLTVSTQQDIQTKRTADTNYWLTVITFLGVIGTGAGIYFNHRHNESQRKDTRDFVNKQLKLQQESVQELKESNKLTRESLNIKKQELRSIMGRPHIELVNTNPEPFSRDATTVTLYPNFKNGGKVPATEITIYYKIVEQEMVPSRDEIEGQAEDIKKNKIEVPGSVSPEKSINLHQLKPPAGISWELTSNSLFIILWFEYRFLEDEHDVVVFVIPITGAGRDGEVIRYDSEC